MADDDGAWTASANEAFVISLVAPGSNGKESKFHPRFTYPIFGEEEEIFGYQDLQINLRYNATDMRPNLQIKFSKQFPAIGDAEPLDIKEVLSEFLPEVAFQPLKDWKSELAKPRDDWTPPGELLTSFTNKAGRFEVWKGTLSDPAVKQLVKRIQILVPLFIEGGTAINVDDKDAGHWTVFFLYQKKTDPSNKKPTYIFAGYSTVYRFFFLHLPPTPPTTPLSDNTSSPSPINDPIVIKEDFPLGTPTVDITTLPCRSRISQFLILPPFQHLSLGSRLYHTVYQTYLSHPPTKEITVEDPNEAFDDMRDINDLRCLRSLPSFQALQINTSTPIPKTGPVPKNIIDEAAAEKVRKEAKITKRQFYRVLEMQLMSRLGESVRPGIGLDESKKVATATERKEYALWKLMLKKRLYVHNRDALGQLQLEERVEKLGEVVKGVEFDYARLLVKMEDQEQKLREEGEGVVVVMNGKGKRKSTTEGVDNDDNGGSVRKKARVEEEEEEEEVPLIVFIGDGVSDSPAMREADVLFARKGLRLEGYCVEHGIKYLPFGSFADIQMMLEEILEEDERKTGGRGRPARFNPRADMWRKVSSRNAVPRYVVMTPMEERVFLWPEAFSELVCDGNVAGNRAGVVNNGEQQMDGAVVPPGLV